ncbi:MAG TPA: glycosyltransferase family protein [Sedimentisphaerales bacterium]|nr:glycosyltransferase family protein [Sedimentisphaerales bacterium]
MARIIYGVAGEGFGHSSRAHGIGQHLIEAGHEVLFAASRKSLSYLQVHFNENVKEIAGLRLAYRDGNLLPFRTLLTNSSRLYSNRKLNSTLYRTVFETFCPDLVISDFEPFSAWWAWRCGIPFISIDHQHLLTMCELERRSDARFPRLCAELVTRCHCPGATAYIIVNFFQVPVKDNRAILAPPVVRPVVESLPPTNGQHILIYTTDISWKDKLAALLNSFPGQAFHVYGLDESRRIGSCEFKRTPTERFLQDLASCRGIIATAGFSLLSESLHFRKKLLLLPIQGQYEQVLNARYAERLGLALNRTSLDADTLREYVSFLDHPIPNRCEILWPDNKAFFDILDQTLDAVWPPFDVVSAGPATQDRLLAGEPRGTSRRSP